MTDTEYFETAKFLWNTYVPKSGQAETVQGELIRAIEKVRDEAQRNGNINFQPDCHGILIRFLRTTLSDKAVFGPQEIQQINTDLDRLEIDEEPYIDDDIYDRLTNRIVDWYIVNKTPKKHIVNEKLYC